MNQIDPFGNNVRSLLQNNGVDPQAARAVQETAQFTAANPPPDNAGNTQYGMALAEFLRQRGHNVTVNP